jgi:hypothetical protein
MGWGREGRSRPEGWGCDCFPTRRSRIRHKVLEKFGIYEVERIGESWVNLKLLEMLEMCRVTDM